MLRIGEFSNLSQVSVKTLHHYDDIGLLQPAHIDAQTGYRYYEAVQLTRLYRIRALKELGFSLEEITLLLRPGLSQSERDQIVVRRREEQEQQVQREQSRLLRLRKLAATSEAEPSDAPITQLPIFYKSVQALQVASWRAPAACQADVQLEQEITARFLTLSAFLQTSSVRGLAAGIMVWHDAEWQEEVTDVEIAVPVDLPPGVVLPTHAFIRVSELPAIPLAACVTYRGSAQGGQAQAAYVALADGLQAQEFQLAGLRRDVTLHYDLMTGDRVVEVQFPVTPVPAEPQ